MFSEFAIQKRFQLYAASFFEDKLCSRKYVGKPQFSSTADPHFLSFIFSVYASFVFHFIIFSLWVNADIHWQYDYRHIGLFQILFVGSCPLSVGWKISVISLGRYMISGQSDTETNSSSRCSSFRIWFQINYHSSEKYANFIHRQSATDYKVQGWKVKKVKKYLLMVWKVKQLTHLLHHRPDSALHWLDLLCMVERNVGTWLRWHQRWSAV